MLWRLRSSEEIIGRLLSCTLLIWVLISPRSVCSDTALAATVTLSIICDTCTAASRRRTVLESTITPSKTRTANAGALMVILYGPGWRSLNRYTPRSSVDTSRATPVALFRASTLAVGTAAPEGSVTLPVSDPYSTWAWREEPSEMASNTAAETTLRRKARADMAGRIWA